MRLIKTGRYWTSYLDDYRVPQRFQENFMSKQLDTITICNNNDPPSGLFQYGGTASLLTGNLTERETGYGRYPSGMGRWTRKRFI